MKENNENWEKQLETVLIEIIGLQELFFNSNLLQLICKLEGVRNYSNISFENYRKTIFECINLLQGFNKNVR